MQAGKLRHSIVIQEPTESNVGGVNTVTWDAYATVRAGVMPKRGGEYWAAKQVQEKEPMIFIIRYCSGITRKMRVLYNDKYYDIQDVMNIGRRNRWIHLITTAYETQG